MVKCCYKWEERAEGKRIEKSCQRETWARSNEFCIFHDPSPEKDVNLFKEMLKEQKRSRTERNNFVGYCFPGEWHFSKRGSRKGFRIDTNFLRVTFKDANFSGAVFQGNASFRGVTSQRNANFSGGVFQGNANFCRVTFQDPNFNNAKFQGNANFSGAEFQGNADFNNAELQGNADFSGAKFQGNAYFHRAIFNDANFKHAEFRDAYFSRATFHDADFRSATFHEEVELKLENVEKLDLRDTKFLFRSYITADLKSTLFHRAFIGNVAFVDCAWPGDDIIYEEKQKEEEAMTFKELETIYRDLEQNLKNHGDYTTAGKFYYRKMEMRRKGAPGKERLWPEVYRFLAGYGEKPMFVIGNFVLVILLAAVLFFFCGVARAGTEIPPKENSDIINYSVRSFTLNIETLKDFGYCVYYSIVTFTTLGYGDIHPLGYSYIVASAEALSGGFLMALFVVTFSRKMMR